MQRLAVAPKITDFSKAIGNIINAWFVAVTERFNLVFKAGAATTTDVPRDQWGLWKNTSTSRVYLTNNDAGTIKSVELVANPSTPVFEAHSTVNQAIPSAAFTKITLNSETYDTDGYYDATNSKFLPLIAGYYNITIQVILDMQAAPPAAGNVAIFAIYKNGVEYSRALMILPAIGGTYGTLLTSNIPMNGTTDFIEVFVFQNTAGAHNALPGDFTYITGFLVRPT